MLLHTFRIFNPILQGEKFDPKGVYVKKWVPELSNIPKKFIHKPWDLNEEIKDFELGKTYPKPIVIHQEARNAALRGFPKKLKNKLYRSTTVFIFFTRTT